MNNTTSNTALILFTRTAAEEAKAKKFSYKIGRKGNEIIASKLIAHATSLAHKAGIAFFVFTEKEQKEGHFGTKLASAYQEIFDKGYERVISIGNDCPSLDRHTLKTAIEELQHHDAVIGPAKDGGVYLLGLNKSEFDLKRFERLKWKTDQLVQDILDNLNEGAKTNCLPTLADIDHDKGLNEFILSSGSELASRLKSLLFSFQSQWYGSHFNSYIGKLTAQSASRRGPPTVKS